MKRKLDTRRKWSRVVAMALSLLVITQTSVADPVTPPEHRRSPEQTFLTYPEWFLVFSPAEYAIFVRAHNPSDFPFLGHIAEFWQSYGAVYEATKNRYPMNWGYHLMIMVIGTSTTVEYGMRAAYETLIGRLAEMTRTNGPTEEDRYAANVAQQYVDFIRVEPWYKFDFRAKLIGLWKDTSLWGPDSLRKWERKYALTTEYGVKAVYGWLIGKATKETYDEPLSVTAVVLSGMPKGQQVSLPDLRVLKHEPNGDIVATVPRYQAFTNYAMMIAKGNVQFKEVAGNDGPILISVIAPASWTPDASMGAPLFTQPIITAPGSKRVALVVPINSMASVLRKLGASNLSIEHIYDF